MIWVPSLAGLGLSSGLKPRISLAYATLKRRSSTVLHVSVMLHKSNPQGLKPISSSASNRGAESAAPPKSVSITVGEEASTIRLETGGEGVRTVEVFGGSRVWVSGHRQNVGFVASGLGRCGWS